MNQREKEIQASTVLRKKSKLKFMTKPHKEWLNPLLGATNHHKSLIILNCFKKEMEVSDSLLGPR